MQFLTPANLPFIFIGVALVYLVIWFRHRGTADKGEIIAQRNRVRMAVIFGAIGGGQLVWRLIGQG